MIRLRALTALAALSMFALFLPPMTDPRAEASGGCIPMKAAFGLAADPGGFSPSTGEQVASWALLAADIERADGLPHPAFDGPHSLFVFATTGGRHVIRILDRALD
jgi:hypothetical protein